MAPAPHASSYYVKDQDSFSRKSGISSTMGYNKALKVPIVGIYSKCLPNSAIYKVLNFSAGFEWGIKGAKGEYKTGTP